MNISLILGSSAFFALGLVSCKDPTSGTTKADVKDAVAKTATGAAGGIRYTFTPESKIGFIGSKVTASHVGGFKTFSGYFTVKDGAPVGNEHKVTIDMSSTFADAGSGKPEDDAKLTGHLKSDSFFDVAKYPTSTFDVTELKKQSDVSYLVSGNFTLHGKTKNISFPATVSKNGDNVKISSDFKINRKDFGIEYPGMPDNLIKDDVVIKLDLEAKPGA